VTVWAVVQDCGLTHSPPTHLIRERGLESENGVHGRGLARDGRDCVAKPEVLEGDVVYVRVRAHTIAIAM
jgi:hypothetical protein